MVLASSTDLVVVHPIMRVFIYALSRLYYYLLHLNNDLSEISQKRNLLLRNNFLF